MPCDPVCTSQSRPSLSLRSPRGSAPRIGTQEGGRIGDGGGRPPPSISHSAAARAATGTAPRRSPRRTPRRRRGGSMRQAASLHRPAAHLVRRSRVGSRFSVVGVETPTFYFVHRRHHPSVHS
eukprot:3041166-Prymnesium_polylepis.1